MALILLDMKKIDVLKDELREAAKDPIPDPLEAEVLLNRAAGTIEDLCFAVDVMRQEVELRAL